MLVFSSPLRGSGPVLPLTIFDNGRSGDTLVSNGIHLPATGEFTLTQADLLTTAVEVNGAQVPAWIEAHVGTWPGRDTLLGVFFQFAAEVGDTVLLRKGVVAPLRRLTKYVPMWHTAVDDTARNRDMPWLVGYPGRMALTSAPFLRATNQLGPLVSAATVAASGDAYMPLHDQRVFGHADSWWDRTQPHPGSVARGDGGGAGLFAREAFKALRTTYVADNRPSAILDYSNPSNDYIAWKQALTNSLGGAPTPNYYDRGRQYLRMAAREAPLHDMGEYIRRGLSLTWNTTMTYLLPALRTKNPQFFVDFRFWPADGVFHAYVLTGNPMMKELLQLMAWWSYGDGSPYSYDTSGDFNRIQNPDNFKGVNVWGTHADGWYWAGYTDLRVLSRIIKSYRNALKAGALEYNYGALICSVFDRLWQRGPNNSYTELSPAVGSTPAHRIFRENERRNPTEFPDGFVSNLFMAALLMEEIIECLRELPAILGPTRVAEAWENLECMAECIWTRYSSVEPDTYGGHNRMLRAVYNAFDPYNSWQKGAFDLTHLWAGPFSALWRHTGKTVWRDRARTMFEDGHWGFARTPGQNIAPIDLRDESMTNGSKQFNEQLFTTPMYMAHVLDGSVI